MGIEHYWLFVISGVLLNLYPGPDTFYIIGRSVAQGRRAGVMSVLGISSGGSVHTLAAAVGLSSILAASATAFQVVKFVGAAYLVYLGLRMIFEKTRVAGAEGAVAQESSETGWVIYRQGLLTNVLNPKVALFFLAFLPQFVDPQASHRAVALVLLGLTFITTGTIWCLVVACAAAQFSVRLRATPKVWMVMKKATGCLFAGMGAKLAMSR